ncbi:hypothetical protein QFZ41_003648 [Luteibacter sp. W1I16]|uniref:hypothetical protein n=1 Tax=Luteibacter sp. W1I16 TaxID=3373922 RepID=UPI003D201D58
MSTPLASRPARGSCLTLAVVAALSGVTFFTPAPSKANDNHESVACIAGMHNATWSPGVTQSVALHTVTVDTTWTCQRQGVPSSDVTTSATSHATFSTSFSCDGIFSTEPTTWTIVWSDDRRPKTSTFVFVAKAAPSNGNMIVSADGEITSGRYRGQNALAQFTLANLAATLSNQCATPTGITSASGNASLSISR